MSPRLQLFWQSILHLVYPKLCWACETLLPLQSGQFCESCFQAIAVDPFPTCPRCSSTVGPYVDVSQGCASCKDKRLAFDGAFRMAPYNGKLRETILRIKHAGAASLAEALAQVWFDAVEQRLRAVQPTVVIPIPLHWSKRWQRGYNQSESLAKHLADRLGVPMQPGWLRRIKRTAEQRTLRNADQRRDNVRGAFRYHGPTDLAGKTILLIDDVLTTGATADEAARTIKKAKPQAVHVAVLAHGH